MFKRAVVNPFTVALVAVFTVSLANAEIANAAENPFSLQPLSSGYTLLAESKCGEGKCGGGKCGAGKSGGEKGNKRRCGMVRMDADGDGKVSRKEFMQGHEAMFDEIDANGDGFIDQDERRAHMKHRKGYMKQGKCGGGKCGEGKCGGGSN